MVGVDTLSDEDGDVCDEECILRIPNKFPNNPSIFFFIVFPSSCSPIPSWCSTSVCDWDILEDRRDDFNDDFNDDFIEGLGDNFDEDGWGVCV